MNPSSTTPRTDAFIAQVLEDHRKGNFDDLQHYMGMCGDLAEWSRNLERELGILKSKREAAVRYGADSLESDSIENSCNCLERTPEAHFHKPGCKYRLISERDEARRECERLRAPLTWTKESPNAPGWWWAQNAGDIPGQVWLGICRVDYNLDGELFASWMTAPGKAATLMYYEWSEYTLWCGPIPEPGALTNK